MLTRFKTMFSKNNTVTETRNEVSCLTQINQKQIPLLSCDEIVTLLKQQNRIGAIKKLTGISDRHFEALYTPALETFIESAQLVPASASNHHCGLGGLVIHTLEVVEYSLRLRKAKQLPLLADPEQIADEEHQWTYGVFCGALLHDAGKMIAATSLKLNTGRRWTPHSTRILDTGATSYSIEFLKPSYNLQTRASSTLMHLLPSTGRDWLAHNPEILSQLSAWLYGLHYEFGVLGEIVREADMKSTARNLGIRNQQRLNNAPSIPLVERLMTALRHLLESEQIKVNRNGAGAWIQGDYAYLVCGAVATKVKEHLSNMGASDIPTDNSRLFDTWQESGYALTNKSGKAIWSMRIENESKDSNECYSHAFTMLKFKTNTLFHPNFRPAAFEGKVSEIAEGETTQDPSTAPDNKQQSTEPRQNDNQTNHFEPANDYKLSSETDGIKQSASSEPTQQSSSSEAETVNHYEAAKTPAATNNLEQPKTSCASNQEAEIESIYDENLLNHFLEWIKLGCKNGRVQINKPNAMIHMTSEGALLVSPRIFQKFVQDFDLAKTVEDLNDPKAESKEKRAFKLIQKRLEKSRLNIKAKNKMNVHMYKINGENKTGKVRGWLVKPDLLFNEDEIPPVNSILENVTGILNQPKKQ